MRELEEEVGISIQIIPDPVTLKDRYFHNKVECVLEPFYAFESVSKTVPDAQTPPRSGHLIVFFRIKLNCRGEDINLMLEPK